MSPIEDIRKDNKMFLKTYRKFWKTTKELKGIQDLLKSINTFQKYKTIWSKKDELVGIVIVAE